MKSERLKEMSRFVVVGLLATAIHYAIYYLLLPTMSPNAAFTVGYAVSFLCNYGLSSRFTFRVDTSVQRFVSFGLSHATNYFIQMVLLNLFIGLGVSEPLAPLPVYVVAVPINYLMVRFALTRRSSDGDGYWLFLMVTGFAMLWLNLLDVPTLSDDMIYRFFWHADDTAPVETIGGFGDLLRSQWTHYLTTNGRFVPHLLAQGLLVFTPSVVMQVLNTLMFVLMVHLGTKWVMGGAYKSLRRNGTDGRDGTDALWAAVAMTFLLFVVFRGFRTTMVWGLGAFNYLWPTVAVLALLVSLNTSTTCPSSSPSPEERGVAAKKASPTGGAWWLLPLLALLAGWTHEALSLPVSIAFAAWIFFHRKGLRSHRLTLVCMLLFMAGTVLTLLSPSIWGRASEGMSIMSRLVNGAVNALTNVRVTWLLVVVLLVMWRRSGIANPLQQPTLRQHLSLHRYEYIALAAALAITLLCGTTLERVAFYTDFIAMILLTRILLAVMARRTKQWLTWGCCAVMLLAYVPAYLVRAENADNWQRAEQQMKEPGRELIAVVIPQKGENRLMDYFRQHYVNSSFEFGFYCVYMGFDATDINMRCAARLYGKERLVFLPEDVVERIESDSTAYTDYELNRNKDLYVWRLKDDRAVKSVTFILNDEDTSKLLPHQRLLAYHGDKYELDDFNYEVVKVGGRPYLVLTKPTTNIFRRIKTINIEQ